MEAEWSRGGTEVEPRCSRGGGAWSLGLQELRAAQVEHELRVDGESGREAERGGVVLAVVRKLANQPDQHAVDPAKDVERLRRSALHPE